MYRTADIRRVEAAAFATAPTPSLMERAGLAAAECARTMLGDGRRVLVTLTKAGLAAINAAVSDHTANEARLVAQLEPADRAALETGLRNLHHAIVNATDAGMT